MSSSGPDLPEERILEGLREYERRPPARRPGRYETLEVIGEGATSIVHRAVDHELGREVAIKILREPLAGMSPEVRERMQREGRVAARLSHPGVVTVFDAMEEDGRFCLVMERVDGEPLADLLARRDGDLRARVGLLEQAARGAAAAHDQGIVHRDLKPGNILVTRDGRAKVADFGIAHVAGASMRLTKTGAPLGTPLYMAPEQVRGDPQSVSTATDVYALGAILYELITGRTPHEAQSVTELYARILEEEPAPPRRWKADAPRDLETITLKALEKDPAGRYPSAREFADDLKRFLDGEPIHASPPGWLGLWRRRMRRRRTALVVGVSILLMLAAASWTAAAMLRRNAETRALGLLESGRQALDRAARSRVRTDGDPSATQAAVDEARSRIEEAIRIAPGLAGGPQLLGRLWQFEGWEERAEASWRRALELDPAFSAAHYDLGRLLFLQALLCRPPFQKKDDAADREAEALINAASGEFAAVSEDAGSEEARTRRRLVEAMSACARKGPAEALPLARAGAEACRGREGEEEFLFLVAVAEPAPEAARRAIDRAIELRPGFAQALALRASPRFALGNIDACLADLDAALRQHPRFTWALLSRASIRLSRGDLRAALADLDRAHEIRPKRPDILVNRAVVLGKLGEQKRAAADFDRAVELDPGSFAARIGRGRHRQENGDPNGAVEDLRRAVDFSPAGSMQRNEAERLLKLAEKQGAADY